MSTTSETKLDWVAFGKYIASCRKKMGMDQKEFAELIKRKQPDVSLIERGKKQVTVETIWRIAEAIELTPATLFSKFQEK